MSQYQRCDNCSPGPEAASGQLLFHCYSSFSDPECETERQQPMSDSNLPAIVGGAVAGSVALIVTVLAVGLVVIMIKRHSRTMHLKRYVRPNAC